MTSDVGRYLVGKCDPIRAGIKAINDSDVHVAVVVDSEQRLLGTVTDGDVRRGLLRGVGLHEPVTQIMNPSPVSMPSGSPREEILFVLQASAVEQMPILDHDGRVVDVVALDSLVRPSSQANHVVVMAGGEGRRLRSVSTDRPKPMMHVGGKPMLEVVLETCIAQGFTQFHFTVNYMREQIMEHFGDGSRWNAHIRYVQESRPLGTAGSLGGLLGLPPIPLLVMNADVLSHVDLAALVRFHDDMGADATMAVREHRTTIPFGVVQSDGTWVEELREKPSIEHFVNAGIYVLSPRVLATVPGDEYLDMTDLLDGSIKENMKVAAYPLHEYWIDAGHPESYVRAQHEWGAASDE